MQTGKVTPRRMLEIRGTGATVSKDVEESETPCVAGGLSSWSSNFGRQPGTSAEGKPSVTVRLGRSLLRVFPGALFVAARKAQSPARVPGSW